MKNGSIRRIIAAVTIFSLVSMSIGTPSVYGESAQSTPHTTQILSPLSEKEIFTLPQTDILGLGQIFPSLDGIDISARYTDNDTEENEEKDDGIRECQEIPKKQIVPCVSKAHIVTKELTVTATAYASTVAQTDSTPCTTANGYNICKANQENVIAANFLPFGTKVKFPDVYGDKIFTVQDRMHKRHAKRVDFWMKTTQKARQFGIKKVKLHVVKEHLAQNF